MLFPILVIVPGMIAIALTSIPSKNYRIPPPIISDQVYAASAEVVRSAASMDAAAAFTAVREAMGRKMDEGRVTALVGAAGTLTDDQIKQGLYNAVAEYDFDGVILSLVKKYCPPGLLGLALTALLASFMSGMAGNVTAFNTVWTYDLYQAYIAPKKSDQHYFWMGQAATVVGILVSIGCAYFASLYNNAMDVIQLVFSFVNAPLFATFILAMFWVRTTGTGAFLGLFGGIGASALVHGLTVAEGKGGWLGTSVYEFPSSMAQNFWLATFAFGACLLLTLGISLGTKRTKTDEELKGLVYSLTPKIKDEGAAWYARPAIVGTVLLIACVIMNIIFW
jgi:SSS family solute:Na+ symporter